MANQAFLASLREGLEHSANVKTVFGDPVISGTRTVIPVARIAYGFGGGSGSRSGSHKSVEGTQGEGSGGGGGVAAIPIGVVEVTPTCTRYISFSGRRRMAAALFVGVLLGMWMGRRRRR